MDIHSNGRRITRILYVLSRLAAGRSAPLLGYPGPRHEKKQTTTPFICFAQGGVCKPTVSSLSCTESLDRNARSLARSTIERLVHRGLYQSCIEHMGKKQPSPLRTGNERRVTCYSNVMSRRIKGTAAHLRPEPTAGCQNYRLVLILQDLPRIEGKNEGGKTHEACVVMPPTGACCYHCRGEAFLYHHSGAHFSAHVLAVSGWDPTGYYIFIIIQAIHKRTGNYHLSILSTHFLHPKKGLNRIMTHITLCSFPRETCRALPA